MTVEYNGGQAGYHNVLGYYTKDINGNIEAHIIYVENQSMVGSKSNMLGTLNNLTGEIGFFIIPNGGNNGITTNSTITFNSTGQMLINGGIQKVYYTDNNLNSDGLDHVVAGMAKDGSGLVIAFEDLQLGDRDYDDVVITINACKPLGTVTQTTLLLEDFENIVRGSDETVGGTGWYVDKGTASDGILVSSNGNQWKMNDAGIEIRKNNGVDGLDTANGSDTYVELDAHTNGVNSSISTTVALGSNDSYDLSFNFTPRAGSLDSSDMQFSLDGQVVQINVDSSGNITFIAPSGVDVTISSISGTSWYKVEATFNNITSSSAELNFKATSNADTLGAYIDNIKLVGNDYSTANTILTNIDLSDVDNANLASAKVELTNYKIEDVIEAPTNSYGITVSINAGVVTLTGTATKAQYEKVLESLTFTSTSEDRTPRTFEFTVNDGDKTSNTMKLTLDIGGCSLNPHTLPNSVDANDDYGQTVVQGEITIDSAVSGVQSSPDITYLDDGGYVIVWEEVNGSSYNGAEYNNETERIEWATRINHDIFAQRFDKDGEPVGEAIQVNTFTTRDQHDANVTVLSNGRYLVTWTSDDDYLNVDNYDNASRYIKGRIYDENNNPVCNEFIVSRAEYDPIIGLPDGGFIVTWSADARYNNTDQGAIDNPIYQDVNDGSEYGIFGQRFDAYGNKVGESFQINTYTSADQIDSDIALDSNGNILITWQSENQDGSSYGIYTQKFELTSSGVTKIGSEVQVNTTTSGAQTDPEITALPNGKAIITWENGTDIYAQILGDNGSKIGSEIKVTSNVSVESNPVVTSISTGFIITWQSNESGNNDIFTQQFDINGVKVGDAIKVNTTVMAEQVEPTITTLSDGGYIIAWQNGDIISAQRFNVDGSKYKTNSFDLDEDSSITITFAELMSNDTDPQGHTFKVTSVSNSQNGTAVLNDANSDGIYDSVKFTPNKDYNGSATFDYTITDEKGAIDKATVHLDVKPKGEPSIFVGTLCSADIKGHDVIVNEGEDVVFAVKVSGAENGSTVTLVLADGTGSNIATNSDYFESYYKYSIDFGTTWITVPSNGVITNISNGNVIMVKTDTVNDSILESKEQFTLTAKLNSPGSAVVSDTGTGTIIDNEAEITVKTVTSDTQTEGTSLVHTVTLSGVADSVKTYAYSFTNGTVESADIGTISFSNGVTYNSTTGLISVPAGVTSFTITTPTVNDTVKEDTETYTISVGGVSASGTITDDDFVMPTSTNDVVIVDEDKPYILTKDDFGTYGNDITKVRIETIPTNGTLLLAGIAVLVGQEISLADIIANKLVFTPITNSDADSSFTFKVSNGTLWSSSSYNTAVNITAVADAPTTSINVTKIGTSSGNASTFDDLTLKTAVGNTSGSEDLNCDLNKSSVTTDITKNYQNLNANNVTTGSGNDTLYFQSVNSGKTISTGAGNDVVTISQSLNGTVNLGDGTNSLGIVGSFNSGTVTAGTGNDTLIVNQGASGVTVNLGNGNNDISVGYALNSSSITTGSGSDTLVVGQAVDNSTIKTGAGDDKVQLNQNVQGTKIYLEDGNDSIQLSSNSDVNFNINTVIDGGKGQDTLYFSGKMEDYKVAVGTDTGTTQLVSWAKFVEMNKNVDGYANQTFTIYEVDANGTLQGSKFLVKNIENVVFESDDTKYSVDISAALTDTDGSESLTVTITNVPTGATLQSSAYTLVDNGNKTWSVTIPAGTKAITDSITMTVPKSNTENIDLGITVKATEANDNTNGLNVATATDSDALAYGIDETNTITLSNVSTNITFIVDVSSSMSDTDINLTEAAINSIINQYNSLGNTKVQIIQFWGDGVKNSGWNDGVNLDADGQLYKDKSGTDPEKGMTEAMNSYNRTVPNADQDVIYYFGDGDPYDAYLTDYNKVLSSWFDFLNTKINDIKAFGINVDNLDMLESSGSVKSLLPVGNNPIYANNSSAANDIVDAVSNTAEFTLNGDVSNNLEDGFDANMTINSIVIDGVEYTKNTLPTTGVILDGDGKLLFDFDTGKYSYTAKSSEFSSDITKSISVNVSDADGDKTSFDVNLKVDIGSSQVVNTYATSGEDIDLTSIISANKSVDVINLDNTTNNKITIQLDDLLVQEDKQLILKGNNGDIVDLDTPNNWSNAGQEQLDGVNYNVYTGTGTNSTIKLLIEDDIDVKPDI